MFEPKIESIYEKSSEKEKEFLDLVRKKQICEIIENLSEQEFENLKKSIQEVFTSIHDLHDIVERGFTKNGDIQSILCCVQEDYFASAVKSEYYRKQALKMTRFLQKNSNRDMDNIEELQEVKLLFYQIIKIPFLEFETSICRAMDSKENIQSQILDRNNQESSKMRTLLEVCQEIRSKIMNVDLQKLLEATNNSELCQDLVYPIHKMPSLSVDASTIKNYEEEILKSMDIVRKCEDSKIRYIEILSLRNKYEQDYNAWRKIIAEVLIMIESWHHEEEELISIVEQTKNSILEIKQNALKQFFFKRDCKEIVFQVLDQLQIASRSISDYWDNKITETKSHINQQVPAILGLSKEKMDLIQNPYIVFDIYFQYANNRNLEEGLSDIQKRILLREMFMNFLKRRKNVDYNKDQLVSMLQTGNLDQDLEMIYKSIHKTLPEKDLQEETIDNLVLYITCQEARAIQEDEIVDSILIKRIGENSNMTK